MHKHGSNETLRFNGFSGSYGYIPNGYGGFNWTDVYYFNNGEASRDEGYRYPIDGRGEAILGGGGGSIVSVDPSESFTLKSMLAESGTSIGTRIILTSYTYSDGTFTKKASDAIYVTTKVQTIDFANLGAKGDFQNIAAVTMVVGSPAYGMGMSYVHTPSGAMAFDNLKVHWNGKIPDGHVEASRGQSVHPIVHHAIAAHPWFESVGETAASSHGSMDYQPHAGSMLTSLDAALGHADSLGGLTSQFALPQIEHFGL